MPRASVVYALALVSLAGCDGKLTDQPPPESLPLAQLTKAHCADGTVDGTEGYVRNVDLDGETPRNPAEAARWTVPAEGIIIPCYARDGVTEIGEFIIGD